MLKLALLDDYQGVALKSAGWDSLAAQCTVTAFRDHLTDEAEIAERLMEFDAVMALRERTPFPRFAAGEIAQPQAYCQRRHAKCRHRSGRGNRAWNRRLWHGRLVKRATMELTWCLILGLLRRLPLEHDSTRAGDWQRSIGIGLEGKTLGLIGLGNIGSQMAEVARAFHMNILAWSQNLTTRASRSQRRNISSP